MKNSLNHYGSEHLLCFRTNIALAGAVCDVEGARPKKAGTAARAFTLRRFACFSHSQVFSFPVHFMCADERRADDEAADDEAADDEAADDEAAADESSSSLRRLALFVLHSSHMGILPLLLVHSLFMPCANAILGRCSWQSP